MRNQITTVITFLCLVSITACSQEEKPEIEENGNTPIVEVEETVQEPHQYGGWYCPDNLNGFPAVDLENWNDVPVVNGRLCNQEESRNGTSLIFIDTAEYPNAKPLDIQMPQLASFFNHSSQREEVVIILQAIQVQEDSIVGFRYLNGGNGSARLNEVDFISENAAAKKTEGKFISLKVDVQATQDEIWEVITSRDRTEELTATFDTDNLLGENWRAKTNVNFAYPKANEATAHFGDIHFGSYYVQNDYKSNGYSEKIFLGEDIETHETELIMVCGPFTDDYQKQLSIMQNWTQKVKELSEN